MYEDNNCQFNDSGCCLKDIAEPYYCIADYKEFEQFLKEFNYTEMEISLVCPYQRYR